MELTHRYFPTPGGASVSLKVEATAANFAVVDKQEFFTKFWAKNVDFNLYGKIRFSSLNCILFWILVNSRDEKCEKILTYTKILPCDIFSSLQSESFFHF